MKTRHLVFCVLAVLAVLFLYGCKKEKRLSTVTVSGVGTVSVQPDTVMMVISLGRTAGTTREAQEQVNVMVRQALHILHDAEIEEKNIRTTSLQFRPEYEWGGQRRILLGQRAEQSISFSVSNINAGNEKISNIIDHLIQINGIELNQMHFSVKETGELYAHSRELAFQKALNKAEQYAKLSGLKVVKVLNIAEEGLPVPHVFSAANVQRAAFSEDKDFALGSTVLPAGELEITSRIMIEFLLK